MSLRLWDNEQPGADKPPGQRGYETVGYVIAGQVELRFGGDHVQLRPGTPWLAPQGVSHNYRIIEPFTAIEATSPPAGC